MTVNQYYLFVLLVFIPVIRIFTKAGFKPYWVLMLGAPYVGLTLCAGFLALAKWPDRSGT